MANYQNLCAHYRSFQLFNWAFDDVRFIRNDRYSVVVFAIEGNVHSACVLDSRNGPIRLG